MNDDFPRQGPDPYPELTRAAEAGLCLIGARRHFRRLSREAMDAFTKADIALRASAFALERPALYRAFDAAHSAYALFSAAKMDGGVSSPALLAYAGSPLGVDPSEHFNGRVDPASGFGAFGFAARGLIPPVRLPREPGLWPRSVARPTPVRG